MWLGIDASSIERPASKTSPDRTVVYKPNLEDEQQADQLWLAVLDGRAPARAAQQLDSGARSAAHWLGANQRPGSRSPTASAGSLAWGASDRGQRSLVQLCPVFAGHRGLALRQIAAPQTQAGVLPPSTGPHGQTWGTTQRWRALGVAVIRARMERPLAAGKAAMRTEILLRSLGGWGCICARHDTSR